MRSRTRVIVACVIAVLIVGGAAAAALTVGLSRGVGVPTVSQAKLQHEAKTIPAALRHRLRLFRTTARASDTGSVPPMSASMAATVNAGPADSVGANPALAKGVETAAGPVYAVPGTRGVCHVASGVVGCGSIAELDAVSHLTTINRVTADPSGTVQVSGVVPDAVTGITIVMRDGSQQPVPVSDDLFGVVVSNQLAEIDYQTSSGTVRQAISYESGSKIPSFQ